MQNNYSDPNAGNAQQGYPSANNQQMNPSAWNAANQAQGYPQYPAMGNQYGAYGVQPPKPPKKSKLVPILIAVIAVLVLVVAIVVVIFVMQNGSSTSSSDATTTVSSSEAEGADSDEADKTEAPARPSQTSHDDLDAKKVGSFSGGSISTTGDAGFIYKTDDGKYGVLSADGKHDTGAIYTYVRSDKNYFLVTNATEASVTGDAASMNRAGVIDAQGNELVPMKYASIDVLNDRYIRVCEVSAVTTNDDEALVYQTDRMFSMTAQDGDTLYKGTWFIYDAQTHQPVPGATGTKASDAYAYGGIVRYYTDAKKNVYSDAKGNILPDGVKVLDNGCYTVSSGNNSGVCYDSEGKELFRFSEGDFAPNYSVRGNDAYLICKKYGDTTKYVVTDLTGKPVSAEFDDMPEVKGDLILVDGSVCDFNGNTVVEGKFEHIYYEEIFGGYWILENGVDHTVIQRDGTVLLQVQESSGGVSVDNYSSFSISKKIGDDNMCYSFKDADYTLKGSDLVSWLVRILNADNTYNIVDAITGKTLIDSIDTYYYVAGPGAVYICGKNSSGTYDIYEIK